MASELPYFRFTVHEWQNGNISLERYELQGFFISLCGYYWLQDCTVTLAMLEKKFSNATILLKELIELGIIKHEKRHDKVEIVFLNRQFDLLSEKRKARQDAGSKGGKAKAKLKQNDGYKDKDKEKKRKRIEFSPPLLQDVKNYFKEKGYLESVAETAFEFYNVADWIDSKGNPVKNWKQKMNSVWFKEEHRAKKESDNPKDYEYWNEPEKRYRTFDAYRMATGVNPSMTQKKRLLSERN